MSVGGSGTPPHPLFVELDFSQAAAVQNTWYTAFNGSNVDFACLVAGITVADETVELRFTVDGLAIAVAAGVALTFAANPYTQVTTITFHSGTPVVTLGAAAATADLTNITRIRWLKGRSVKIEARKTTAGGASALVVRGIYFKC